MQFHTTGIVLAALTVVSAASAQSATAYFAWGWNSSGQTNLPSLPQGCAFAVGSRHSLALTPAGTVVAWGENDWQQCSVPSDLPPVMRIAAGGWWSASDKRGHSVALLQSGQVRAWGCNDYGQCNVPQQLEHVIDVACGWSHSVALRSDHGVVVWGAGSSYGADPHWGQLNIPPNLGAVTSISSRGCHVLALREDGYLTGWGRSGEQQLNIPTGVTFVQAEAGSDHSLGLTEEGRVMAWGFNNYGQATVPLDLATQRVRQISATLYGSCALLEDGSVRGWGSLGSAPSTGAPTDLPKLSRLYSGGFHIIGVSGDGEISGVIPPSGPSSGGTEVIITGRGFSANPVVRLNGARIIPVNRISDSKVSIVTPGGLPGNVLVDVDGFRARAFYYRPECGSDLDQDGEVTAADISIVLLDFGPCYQTPLAAPAPEVPPLLDAQALPDAPRQR